MANIPTRAVPRPERSLSARNFVDRSSSRCSRSNISNKKSVAITRSDRLSKMPTHTFDPDETYTEGIRNKGRVKVQMAAKEFGVEPKYRILSRPMIKIAGWFKSDIRESYEMLYQSDSEYPFDSTKFSKAFNFQALPYSEGIKRTAAAYNLPKE